MKSLLWWPLLKLWTCGIDVVEGRMRKSTFGEMESRKSISTRWTHMLEEPPIFTSGDGWTGKATTTKQAKLSKTQFHSKFTNNSQWCVDWTIYSDSWQQKMRWLTVIQQIMKWRCHLVDFSVASLLLGVDDGYRITRSVEIYLPKVPHISHMNFFLFFSCWQWWWLSCNDISIYTTTM